MAGWALWNQVCWCKDLNRSAFRKQTKAGERHGNVQVVLFLFTFCSTATNSFSTPPSFFSHFILTFSTKRKKIMYHFLFNSQGSIAFILKLSRSPEAFQSFFCLWCNLYYLLPGLRRLSDGPLTDAQRCARVPASHPAFTGQGKSCCALEGDRIHAEGWTSSCFTLNTKEQHSTPALYKSEVINVRFT